MKKSYIGWRLSSEIIIKRSEVHIVGIYRHDTAKENRYILWIETQDRDWTYQTVLKWYPIPSINNFLTHYVFPSKNTLLDQNVVSVYIYTHTSNERNYLSGVLHSRPKLRAYLSPDWKWKGMMFPSQSNHHMLSFNEM